MTTDLQAALIPLAEKAGYGLKPCHEDCSAVGVVEHSTIWDVVNKGVRWWTLPGADGTLEGEVELVLGWLAKAGYVYQGFYATGKHVFTTRNNATMLKTQGEGDTLHAALAAAVIALHEATDA